MIASFISINVISINGAGYRIDYTNGVPSGNEPEGIYAVVDGTRSNNHCCFDYGNAEVSNSDTGDAHMEAVCELSGATVAMQMLMLLSTPSLRRRHVDRQRSWTWALGHG